MSLLIRVATSADVPAITEIYNQAIALGNATAHTNPLSEIDRAGWLAQHPPEALPVFVAETNNQVAGYCSISEYRPGREALRHTLEISYYVHQDFRSRGVGSALIEHSITKCPAMGIKTLFAVLLDNNPGSVALLEKFGFEKWGHMPNVADFDDNEVGHLYYGLRVPAS